MKKVILTSAILLAFSAVGMASPLTDYSQGKVAVDISVRPSMDVEGSDSSGILKADGKNNNLDLGLTVGLGNKFAFQYKNNHGDSKKYLVNDIIYGYAINGTIHSELKAQEFNMLYKVDKSLSAFLGYTTAKASLHASGTVDGQPAAGSLAGNSANGYQVGLIGTTLIGDKAVAYGVLGIGNKISSYEIGLSYEVAKDIDLNIFYKDTKYKKLKLEYNGTQSGEFDYKASGIGYGVTFKF